MVLIVNRRKRDANAVGEMFHFMGILSHPATPTEALSEISLLYRAVIIMEPQTLPDAEDFVRRIKSYVKTMPVFAVSDSIEEFKNKEIFDGRYKFSIFSSTLANNMIEVARSLGQPLIGDYRVAGINASCDSGRVTYFDRAIPFTKTEAMIVRILLRAYPLPLPSSKILKYAFRPSRSPEVASIRTHISSINKKFREIFERNIIMLVPDSGYVISTPETRLEAKLHGDTISN